ncbi:hypothetical protein BHE74_00021963 [Ensete ventricosum]|nr:hypothetical protein BHE74_00021963 [Ensete ventricosum]
MQARWEKLKNSTKIWNDPSARGVRKGTSTSAVGEGTIHAPIGGASCPSHQGDGAEPACPYGVVRSSLTFMDYHITSLQQDIDALKSGWGPKAVATAEERASKLEKELEKIKRERDEALQQLKYLTKNKGRMKEARRAFELEKELKKTKRERDEVL